MPDIIEQAIQQPTGLSIDREKGLIEGVKILGAKSRNGNFYTDQALNAVASLYEGVDVYDGHHTRKYSDHVGTITAPYRKGDAVFGALQLRKHHALYEQVLDDAENNPGNLALSHEVMDGDYEATMVSEGRRIDDIFKVDAVAIVKRGGTNKSLVEEEDVATKEIKTLDDLREAYGPLVEELEASLSESIHAKAAKDDKLARVITERDEAIQKQNELQEKLDLIEQEKQLAALKAEILEEAQGMGIEAKDISDDLMEEFVGGMKREMVTAFLKNMKPKQTRQVESTPGTASTGDSDDKPFYVRG